jgi:hypothetical protein
MEGSVVTLLHTGTGAAPPVPPVAVPPTLEPPVASPPEAEPPEAIEQEFQAPLMHRQVRLPLTQ